MLRITGKRADGYHDLQTVFQFIDCCDQVSFRRRSDKDVVRAREIEGVPAEQDLVVKAARLLRERSGVSEGVEIKVQKNLPMGGGVGGGSSDAATTLCVLNRLWEVDFSQSKLMELGLSLGADVPVFINGRAAWAEGVGDKLTALELNEPWYVVIVPACHVSTKDIFSDPELTRDSIPITITGFVSGAHRENDCRSVVVSRYAVVRKALEALSIYGEARLTGTGACVYAEFPEEEQAEQAKNGLMADWSCFVAKGLNGSPLLERMSVL
jgi:4-diphosphocytidyl-2-C-methyl-D-erythritol kinase